MQRKNVTALACVLSLAAPLSLALQNQAIPTPATLQGDEADACSAVLCLSSSSGRRVSECQPPLNRYFSITGKDRYKKRRDFLDKCPSGDFANRDSYLDALANASGRCSAAYLNATLKQSVRFESCKPSKEGEVCTPFYKYRIGNQLPSYCQAVLSSGYTDFNLHYVGSSEWQTAEPFSTKPAGQWVDK